MLADRLRIKRRNPYVPGALVAVTHWDILSTGAPVQAFRVYDAATMQEIAGIPTLETYSPFGAFSPGGTHYAVILQGESLSATLKIYNVADWTEAFSGAIPDAANDTGHVSWSPNGRFVCAFVGPRHLFLDRDNDWAASTIDMPEPNTDNAEYTSAFVGNSGLVVGGGFDSHVSLHSIDAVSPVTLTPVRDFTAIADQAITHVRGVVARRPTDGQVLTDVQYGLFVQRAGFVDRLWVLPWDSESRIVDAALTSGSPIFPSLTFTSNSDTLAISNANGATPTIRRFDATNWLSPELDSLALAASTSETIVGWSHSRESYFIANNKTGDRFTLREFDGSTLDLVASHDEDELRGYPTSVSVSDWPVSELLPPVPPS